MNQVKQYKLTTIIGLFLMTCGYFSKRFLIIKPNRILEGTVIDMHTVIKDSSILFTAFFLLLIITVIYVFKKRNRWYLLTLSASILFLYFFYRIGEYSQTVQTTFSETAIISLSIGFWLFIVGLIIIIDSSCHYDLNYQPNRLFLVLSVLFIGLVILTQKHYFENIGIIKELHVRQDQYVEAFKEHLTLTIVASVIGLIISVIMSYFAYKHKQYKKYFLFISNSAQVIPTLSFLGLLMIPLTLLSKQFNFLKAIGISGIGFFPAFIVLTSYTLLPIINQSLSAFELINRNVIVSAEAMGMKQLQVFAKVELPLSLPGILSGFKIAMIQTTANAILAGLVGGGGLGTLLFLGLAQSAPDLVTLSALSIVMIALVLNGILSMSIRSIEKRRGLL